MRFKIGQGFDFHPLEEGRKLVLGGVEIEHKAGLRGHSDADVSAHALANAILGALGEGDLGRHFPDTDPRYRDADSLALLSTVWRRAAGLGWRLVNADITIFAQRPRLGPHLPAMVERLVYLGSATQVFLRLAAGTDIQALLQNDGGHDELAQGTPVHAYLAPDALRVLRGGTPAADPTATSAEPDVVRQAS